MLINQHFLISPRRLIFFNVIAFLIKVIKTGDRYYLIVFPPKWQALYNDNTKKTVKMKKQIKEKV